MRGLSNRGEVHVDGQAGSGVARTCEHSKQETQRASVAASGRGRGGWEALPRGFWGSLYHLTVFLKSGKVACKPTTLVLSDHLLVTGLPTYTLQ